MNLVLCEQSFPMNITVFEVIQRAQIVRPPTDFLTCGDQTFAAVTVKGSVLWDVTPFSLAVTHQITRRYLPEVNNIWHYNPLWVFTFSAKSLQVLLSLAVSFQFFTFSFFRSSMTSSCHRCLGLPTGLVPIGLQSNSFLVGPAWSIRCLCPSHLILCALMHLTISAPYINLPISMLFRILYILSILVGPNVCLSICLSKNLVDLL